MVGAQTVQPGKFGEELRESLREEFTSTNVLSYRNARRAMFGHIDNSQGEVRLVYTGSLFGTSGIPNHNVVNTEHTWPRSKFKHAQNSRQMKTDLHHLFPTWNKVNGERGSFPFGEIPDTETDAWWNDRTAELVIPSSDIDEYSESVEGVFEPREDHKGNVARSMFYFFTMYEKRGINVEWFLPQVPTLLAWHALDPSDEIEKQRSQAIEQRQGNNNPFVFDPTLANRIFSAGPTEPSPIFLMIDRTNRPINTTEIARNDLAKESEEAAADRANNHVAPSNANTPTAGQLELHFLDVEQGDCTLIRCPNGLTVLIDCGSFGGSSISNRARDYLLNQLPGMEIDIVVITHPDSDHYKLLPDVLNGFQIGKLLHVGVSDEHSVSNTDDWIESLSAVTDIIESHELDPANMQSDIFDSGEVEFHIIAADVASSVSSKNARSIVFRVDLGDFEAILTGDATFDTEEQVVVGYDSTFLDVELLKIGHHGSSTTSTSAGWIEFLRPKAAVVSAGFNNRFDHPRKVVIDRVANSTVEGAPEHFMRWGVRQQDRTDLQTISGYEEAIFNTASNGHIVVTTDGDKYKIKYGRPGRFSGEMDLMAEVAAALPAPARLAAVGEISISRANMNAELEGAAPLAPANLSNRTRILTRAQRIRAMELELLDHDHEDEGHGVVQSQSDVESTVAIPKIAESDVRLLVGERVVVRTAASTFEGVLEAINNEGWVQLKEDGMSNPTFIRDQSIAVRKK